MSKHYVNEAGTDLVLDTGINIGTVDDQYIKYLNPDGVSGSFDASVYSSYSVLAVATGSYLLKHTLVRTDLDVAGVWTFQAFVAAVDGTWYGESVKLDVLDEFE